MDIRFTNRWEGLDYYELYCILDGLIALTCKGINDDKIKDLIHDLNQELIKRRKEGGKYDDSRHR